MSNCDGVFLALGGLLVKKINEMLGLSVKTVEMDRGAHSPRFKPWAIGMNVLSNGFNHF